MGERSNGRTGGDIQELELERGLPSPAESGSYVDAFMKVAAFDHAEAALKKAA